MSDLQDHRADDPAPVPTLRPVRASARCAALALGLAGLAWAGRAVWQVRLAVAGEPAGGPPDQGGGQHRPLIGLEDAYHIVTSVGNAVTALCAVAFLAWLWRVRDNAQVLSGRPPRYSWIWVYGGWVVPVANLWVPRGIIADVHRSGAPGERLPRALNWWWGLWLAGMLSGVGLMYTGSTDDVIARAYTDVAGLLAADAAVVGAAVAGVLLVRAVSFAQQARIDSGRPARAG
ncbi:DUF4328 domain-containing protein [Streptomyces sp. NEAU-NA10]|uniref:DUF4328 domain-containing protein n=1 Tax=Streptomyces sp. NEAU-NA10 TaxID=3416050 RepID=UPI003CC5C7C2